VPKSPNDIDQSQIGTLLYHADSVSDLDEEEQVGENSTENSSGQQLDPSGHDKKDDWDLAVRFRDIQRYGHIEPKLKKEMGEKAIRAILDRARAAFGPVQKPYRYEMVHESLGEDLKARGASVELDIEESLAEREIRYQARVEKNYGIILLLDTSLSMKGEKLALLGVTIAAVASMIPASALCILGFDSEIHVIKEFNEIISSEALISRALAIPPGGFTNIERGLDAAKLRMGNGGHARARIILVSDGRYTEGKDPVEVAKKFPIIYPVKLGKDPGGRAVMKEIAATGLGRFSEVREMKELPKFLLNAIRSWVK
jgi:hypothetical protein